MRAVFFSYDIPSYTKIANPSHRLHRCGIRANLSVWVIPEHMIPTDLLEIFDANHVKYHLVRFDESEHAKLLKMAKDALESETETIIRSMQGSLERAQDALFRAEMAVEAGEMVVTDDNQTPAKKYDRLVKSILRNARKQAVSAEEAAIAFDLLGTVQEAINSTKRSISAAHNAFIAEGNAEAGTLALYAAS
jgi:hypothetical protein